MTAIYRNSWIPDVFNDFLNTDNMPKANATAPAINVLETANEYIVELAAPGMHKGDFEINIDEDGDLRIKMEKKNADNADNKKAHYLRREFAYSHFEQTLILPDDVDKAKISAKVEDGVLTVNLPKVNKEEKKVSRHIEIG